MLISYLLLRLIMLCCCIVNFDLRISANLLCDARVADSNFIKLKVPFYTYSSTSACMSDQRYKYLRWIKHSPCWISLFTDLELEGPFHVGKLGGVGVGAGECCWSCTALSQIFPNLGFFAGFSQCIITIAGRVSDAAMGGRRAAPRFACKWA